MTYPKLAAALATALSLTILAPSPAHAEYPGTMVSGTGSEDVMAELSAMVEDGFGEP